MREWFSPLELAGLPGLPSTDRRIRSAAERSGWETRKKSTGKGYEYHLSSLPDQARAHLITQHQRTETAAARQSVRDAVRAAVAATHPHLLEPAQISLPEAGFSDAAGFSGARAARMQARIDCIAAMTDWLQRMGIANTPGADGRKRAINLFVSAWNTGAVHGYSDAQRITGSIDTATIYRWISALTTQGPARLSGQYGNRRGTGQIDSDHALLTLCESFVYEYPHAGPRHLIDAVSARTGQTLAESTVRRWMTAYKAKNQFSLLAATNPDAWKDRHLSAFGDASEEAEYPNHIWELDGTSADIMLIDGASGEVRRSTIIACIDVFSRRLRYLVARTGTSAGVASLMRRCILDWGVPHTVHTDNGADYVAEHIKRFVTALEIEQRLCTPFSPWQKPHIERSMRTMSHDLVELLPGFVGHNVGERQKIEDRKAFSERLFRRGETVELRMTPEQLQGFLDDWVSAYESRAHSGLDGHTPAIKAAQTQHPVRRITDPRALDLLLYPAGTRTVSKKGIRLEHCLYIAPELAAHIGADVLVRLDPEDQGRVVVFEADGAYLCDAVDPDATGVSRRDVAIAARKVGRDAAAAGREHAKRLRAQHNTKTLAQDILDARLAELPNVIALPRPAIPHDTPALDDAKTALQGGIKTPQTVDDNVVRLRQQQAIESGSFDAKAAETDPRKIHAAWMRIEARVASGEYVTADEKAGLSEYRRSQTYRSMAEAFEAFDLDWRVFATE
ncbi:conserved hypothetical protein [Thiomonas sp. CB3]|nr:conserved hypothetical protein [Thiomonas sp. CB3]